MNDLHVGMVIKSDGGLYKVLTRHHKKKNRGKPTTVCKLKNLNNGNVVEKTFHGRDTVEEVFIDREDIKFVYGNRGKFVFSDPENPRERFELDEETLGEVINYIKPSDIVQAMKYEDKIIGINIPIKVDLKVTEAPPNLKGDTQGSAYKEVEIETGATVKTPMFINKGDVIKVNTETGEYVERVEKA